MSDTVIIYNSSSFFLFKECHHNVVQFQIPSSSNRNLSQIFTVMENASEKYNIEDYSVSQTSLDNVANDFVFVFSLPFFDY